MINRIINKLATTFLSEYELKAYRQLEFERKVSQYHKKGLKKLQTNAFDHLKKINLGCGPVPKDGFLNVDLFLGDVTLDLRRPLPFSNDTYDCIFSEHCFEHFDYPSPINSIFGECLRILKPGGSLLFSVPDTEWAIIDYEKGYDSLYMKACLENPQWHPDYCTTPMEHINYHFRQHEEHKFAYDFETAKKLLKQVGFSEINNRAFDPQLDSVHRRIGSLFVEAKKASV